MLRGSIVSKRTLSLLEESSLLSLVLTISIISGTNHLYLLWYEPSALSLLEESSLLSLV